MTEQKKKKKKTYITWLKLKINFIVFIVLTLLCQNFLMGVFGTQALQLCTWLREHLSSICTKGSSLFINVNCDLFTGFIFVLKTEWRSRTLSFYVVCTTFDLQAESSPHLWHRCEAPGSLWSIWVTAVVLLQTSEWQVTQNKHHATNDMSLKLFVWLHLKCRYHIEFVTSHEDW